MLPVATVLTGVQNGGEHSSQALRPFCLLLWLPGGSIWCGFSIGMTELSAESGC